MRIGSRCRRRRERRSYGSVPKGADNGYPSVMSTMVFIPCCRSRRPASRKAPLLGRRQCYLVCAGFEMVSCSICRSNDRSMDEGLMKPNLVVATSTHVEEGQAVLLGVLLGFLHHAGPVDGALGEEEELGEPPVYVMSMFINVKILESRCTAALRRDDTTRTAWKSWSRRGAAS